MAFLDTGGTLEDALNQQAQTAREGIGQQYARRRRQAVSQQAKAGRLGSGVSNYQFGDINAAEAGALGGVENALSTALGQVPIGDYSTQQDNARKRELAQLLAEISKPSSLEEALGAFSTFGNLAGNAAALAAL